ncbi:MAG TPA: polysaccharide deacetylase family protein [Dongiaceae bacterium]|nr:polysaccharide deacetylase family protein [Dongiaceae bacterium]
MTGRAVRWMLSLMRSSRLADGAGGPRLTIVRHHRVYADTERPLYRLGVSESVFAAQLAVLGQEGLTPLTVSAGLEHLAEGRPGHVVAMSFDDGYADNVWRALPRLQAVQAKATFFLTAGLMEERRAPWWDELAHALEHTRESRLSGDLGAGPVDLPLRTQVERRAALQTLTGQMRVPPPERDRRLAQLRLRLGVSQPAECELAGWDAAQALVRAGMEVGAHTLTHPHLTTLPAESQAHEIGGSVELIERRLGGRVRGFAYPGGDYDARTLEVVDRLGLDYAVTTRAGVNVAGAPPHELRRRGLSEGACLGPSGRLSRRLTLAELEGAFDGIRASRDAAS